MINGLSGSKSITTYTNKEVSDAIIARNGGHGWSIQTIENNSTGFTRNDLPSDQIGAYVITNETGVSYHYTLPAYSFDEYQYSENIERGEGHSFNELRRPEKYAYTWHLTAITGPDFVDRGVIGELDKEDWGYWVDFEYGKWTDQYFWRNPGEELNIDMDNNFQNFSEGTKELYYLDAIKTKTHTALFIKEMREDAISSLPLIKNLTRKSSNSAGYELTEAVRKGGYGEQDHTCFCNLDVSNAFHDWGILNYRARSTKSLKLNKIALFDNDDIPSIDKSLGAPLSANNNRQWSVLEDSDMTPTIFDDCDFSPLNINHHLFENVYDLYDYQANPLEDKSVRVIDLDNDHYDLVPETPNSSSGKLTLKGISFKGKSGLNVTPPMKFFYEENSEVKHVSAETYLSLNTLILDENISSFAQEGSLFESY